MPFVNCGEADSPLFLLFVPAKVGPEREIRYTLYMVQDIRILFQGEVFSVMVQHTALAPSSTDSLEELVIQVQQGDERLRHDLLKDYYPFMVKTASKVCKKYIDIRQDDEFSIALSAFNEALDHYSPKESRSFLSFAEMVIQRRLIDYIRREQRFQKQLPLSSFEIEDEEEHYLNPVEVEESLRLFEQEQQGIARRTEIKLYARHLKEFGISLQELVRLSPKHQDSRQLLFEVAHILASNQELVAQLLEKKTLPIKDLLKVVKVSRKTLERHRKYIISMALILIFDYPYLREYLEFPQAEKV
jgi:RNA polymerase sigma factor